MAVEPTPNNVKKVEARRQEIERMERERRADQERLLKQLAGVEVTMERKANEQGHLFGSVTATDISKALQGQGFNINPDDINLPGRLDRIETYMVRVKFAEDLAQDLKVWIAPDAESKALIGAAQKAAADAAALQQATEAPAPAAKAEEPPAKPKARTRAEQRIDAKHKKEEKQEPQA